MALIEHESSTVCCDHPNHASPLAESRSLLTPIYIPRPAGRELEQGSNLDLVEMFTCHVLPPHGSFHESWMCHSTLPYPRNIVAFCCTKIHSSERERKEQQEWKKSRKAEKIPIDREQVLAVNLAQLPSDAEFKGYEEVIVQDIRIQTDNVVDCRESEAVTIGGVVETSVELPRFIEKIRKKDYPKSGDTDAYSYALGTPLNHYGTLVVATEEISVQFAVYQKVDMKARGSYTITPPPNSTQPMAAQ